MICDVYDFNRKNTHAFSWQIKTPELVLSKKTLEKNIVWETQLIVISIKPDFCCAFGCSDKRKTGSKSNIIYYRIPFSTDPESLFHRKRWIAAIRRENRTGDQIDNSRKCRKHFISGKSKKTVMVSRSLVFLFVSVAFKNFVFQASDQKTKILQNSIFLYFSIFLYSKY